MFRYNATPAKTPMARFVKKEKSILKFKESQGTSKSQNNLEKGNKAGGLSHFTSYHTATVQKTGVLV